MTLADRERSNRERRHAFYVGARTVAEYAIKCWHVPMGVLSAEDADGGLRDWLAALEAWSKGEMGEAMPKLPDGSMKEIEKGQTFKGHPIGKLAPNEIWVGLPAIADELEDKA